MAIDRKIVIALLRLGISKDRVAKYLLLNRKTLFNHLRKYPISEAELSEEQELTILLSQDEIKIVIQNHNDEMNSQNEKTTSKDIPNMGDLTLQDSQNGKPNGVVIPKMGNTGMNINSENNELLKMGRRESKDIPNVGSINIHITLNFDGLPNWDGKTNHL